MIDVDGPLNPWAAKVKPPGYEPVDLKIGWRKRLRIHLNPSHGPRLLATGMELAWATSWGHRANTMIGPVLGLPNLRVIDADERTWKYGPIGRYAYGRPLAWLDDDFALHETARNQFLERRKDVPTRLVHVDPHTGLTDEHWAELAAFAATVDHLHDT